jgi:RNA polymerase sigma-70 factor (ECF subfamily)
MKADIELVQDVRAGSKKAFSELVERHQKALLRLSFRFTRDQSQAEDIVQESFIKAYQKIHLFEGRSSFKSWIFQIAVNTAKNKLRANQHDTVNIDDVNLGVDPGALSGMVQMDVKHIISIEVEKLPDRQRTALKLRIFEDLSFKEIADIMACPYDTAKANYRHALMKLRANLEQMHALRDLSDFQSFFTTEMGNTKSGLGIVRRAAGDVGVEQ